MTPNGFNTWREYFSFTLAREYMSRDTGELFSFQPGYLERAGKVFSFVVLTPLDAFLRGIRNPLVILSLTMISLFFVSIAFYPVQTWALASSAIPLIKGIKSSHIQAACYLVSQGLILGLGLRAVGRLSNQSLMDAYRAGSIVPVPIGARVIRS
ncbi:MAG TPA: hypothetical protein VGM34_03585 [Chlamydiales bacterium]|jgi:hypothetical protein